MEAIEVAEPVIKQPVPEKPQVKPREFPKIDYVALGDSFSLDAKSPHKPDEWRFDTGNSNFFSENDTPTLAGKIVQNKYGEMILRRDKVDMPADAPNRHRIVMREFTKKVSEIAASRSGGEPSRSIKVGVWHDEGQNDFHMNGSGEPRDDHVYYFNKSTRYWKNPREGMARAYVTVNPREYERNQEHFTNLTMELFDSGVDFSAKATGVKGTIERMDNMVFYISNSDKDKAAAILRKYIGEKRIAGGQVEAAVKDDQQDGLSWAPEPGKAENDFYQKVTGSTNRASFNSFVATRALPRYLERLTSACAKTGDTKSAAIYLKELQRVNGILADVRAGK